MDAVLDPKRLLDLLRIAEHGSYTRAAAALGVSQPALSNSIAALEKMLGVGVLDRTRHGAKLTEFGHLLVTHAEALQSVLSRASGDVAGKKRGVDGSLAIGVSPIACIELVPDAIAKLKHERPQVAISVHELADVSLITQLRAGKIDVAVAPTGLLTDPPDIEREVLLNDYFVAIMRPQNPFARRRALSLADLRHAQWIMPTPDTTMWRQIEAMFVAASESWPTNCIITNSITASKSLVMRTDSISLSSPRLVQFECDSGYLKAVPLREPHFAREICLRRRKNVSLTPVSRRFIELLKAGSATTKASRPPAIAAEKARLPRYE